MPDAINVGAAIREIKERTGWTWREVGEHLGTTGEYARKLATKTTSSGAGRALAPNVARFQRTGAAQNPVQRAQRVRAKGGGTVAATPRTAPAKRAAFKVTRSVFRGAQRDGWAVQVTVPRRATKAGDREDARHAIMDATRRAAQGRRRVMFNVTFTDSQGRSHTVEFGGHGGYDASSALRGMKAEGLDPLAWIMDQNANRYKKITGEGGGSYDVEELDAAHITGFEVVAMP